MLYLLPKSTEKMDRHWIIGFLRDDSCRRCWLDAWLLHGNAGAQLCVWGGVQVVTKLAAPGGSLVTLPVTRGTQITGRKPLWGQWALGVCGLLPRVHSAQGWALGQVRGAAGG